MLEVYAMIRALCLALLAAVLGGCQFLEPVGPRPTDPLPAPATAVPRFSPSLEIPPPR